MIQLELKKSCKKITLNPFSYAVSSAGTAALAAVVLLSVQVAMLAVTKSWASLVLICCSTAASAAAQAVFFFCGKKMPCGRTWSIAAVQGLVAGMLVPSSYPPLSVFAAAFLIFALGTYFFGSFAGSWANPVALLVAVLYFLNPQYFPSLSLSAADIQSRNASLSLIQSGAVPLLQCDPSVTSFLNAAVFKWFGVSIPEGYVSLFWDSGSSIAAFRFNCITLLSSLFLILFDMAEAAVPALFLLVYALLVRFLSPVITGGIPLQGDCLLALLTSGTLFCTFYLLQWYGTVPVTRGGKAAYGIAAGAAGFVIIGIGASSAGYAFTVLVMNLVSLFIQVLEDNLLLRTVSRQLLPRIQKMDEV